MSDNGTVGRIYTMTCAKPASGVPPGTPEMTAWDGVQRSSPVEEYLKTARGGLDPVRGDTFHAQQAANTSDAVLGEIIGLGVGKVLQLGGRLFGAAKGVVKSETKVVAESRSAARTGAVVASTRSKLDWDAVVPKKGKCKGEARKDHVRRHNSDDLSKENHGVFEGDGVDITNRAWDRAQDLGITPNSNGEIIVPMGEQVGVSGGSLGKGAPLSRVRIIVEPGTNNVITSMPY